MLSKEERQEICKKVLTEGAEGFVKQVREAFMNERITEAEFYNAMGLHRIDAMLYETWKLLQNLSGELASELKRKR